MTDGLANIIWRLFRIPQSAFDIAVESGVVFSSQPETFSKLKDLLFRKEDGYDIYYQQRDNWRFYRLAQPVYHALLPHLTFEGKGIQPVWVNRAGRAVVAWHVANDKKTLLIGLDVEEELIRHWHGNPLDVNDVQDKSAFGFAFERPNYLFDAQLDKNHRTQPWADNLGFFLAETFSRMSGFPLLEPLPTGARGAILLTGDDDQAFLEKYAEQLGAIGKIPITYFLHFLTKHTPETIKALPSNVEFGLHPDALDQPELYDVLCAQQAQKIQALVGRPMQLVRNHGFLSQGYLGHLSTWEKNGLRLDSNYPGVDGTALNGSFLPVPVRRIDGTWSDHYSLLTLFGDGMIASYGPHLTIRQAIRRIHQLAHQIEKSHPGLMVFNFHPQNISETMKLHEAVVRLVKRPGWIALGLESYLEWFKSLDNLKITQVEKNRFSLTTSIPVKDVVLRYPLPGGGWSRKSLEPWIGEIEVDLQ